MKKVTKLSLSSAMFFGLGACNPAMFGADLSLKKLPCDTFLGDQDRSAALPLPMVPASLVESRDEGSGLNIGALAIRAAAENSDLRSEEQSFAEEVERSLGVDLRRLNAEDLSEASAERADRLFAELETLRTQVAGAAAIGSADSRSDIEAALPVLTFSRARWKANLEEIAKTTAENGWTSAFARDLGNLSLDGRSEDENEREKLRKKYLIAAYLSAYFRHGKVFALEFSDENLKGKLLEKLKSKVSDQNIIDAVSGEIDKLAADYRKALCEKDEADDGPCVLLGVIGEQTFVTRAGKSYGFPGITATIDIVAGKKVSTNKIAMGDIPPDLIRVVMEAIGDEAFHVPGEKNSTLCEVRELCSDDASAKKLSFVNEVGDRVEAGSTSTVGAAVRGGWLASLNNEVLADTLTTAVAVSFRKASEAAAWAAVERCAVDRSGVENGYRSVSVRFVK